MTKDKSSVINMSHGSTVNYKLFPPAYAALSNKRVDSLIEAVTHCTNSRVKLRLGE